MNKEIAILIMTCDKYEDIWTIFNLSFEKNWSDCPYPIYWSSNTKRNSKLKFQHNDILIGQDRDYSTNLLATLESIKEKYVLLWIEDLILTKRVDNTNVNLIINDFIKIDGDYLKISSGYPVAYKKSHNSIFFGELPQKIKYRLGIGLTIYKRDFLCKILQTGESAWDFERNATSRVDKDSIILSLHKKHQKSTFQIYNLVVKGNWNYSAEKILSILGLSHLMQTRKRISFLQYLYILIYSLRLKIYSLFNLYWK